jgi:hypothetical protein
MSKVFRDVMVDVLTHIEPFRDSISNLLMRKNTDGSITAVAKARDGNIALMIESKEEIPEFDHIACFGSLPYLRSILKSSYFNGKSKGSVGMNINMEFDTASNGETTALRSIQFTTKSGKFEALYQATDPFVNNLNKVKLPTIDIWDADFVIGQNEIKDFAEVLKIHKAAPKIGGDRDDIFKLTIDDGVVQAIFGDKGHHSMVTLGENVDIVTDLTGINSLFSISKLEAMFKLIGKGEAQCSVAEKAFRVQLETPWCTYSIVTVAKKLGI